jgi:actin-related protein 6
MAPARKSRSTGPPPPSRTLVLDNGAYTIKAGFVTGESSRDEQPRVIPNCVARDRHRKTYVGSELEKCKDFGEIAVRRPVEKGFVVNWEAEKEIWDREFFDDKAPLRCDPSESRLVLTEQPNALPALQSHCDQMVFEEYGFASYYRGVGSYSLSPTGVHTTSSLANHASLLIQAPHSTRITTCKRYSEPLETHTRRSKSPPRSCWW